MLRIARFGTRSDARLLRAHHRFCTFMRTILLVFALFASSHGKVITADMRTVLKRYSDIYLGSFTFDAGGGKIVVNTKTAVSGQRLLFFDGATESWPMVLKTYEELSCVGLRNVSLLVTEDSEDGSLSEGLAVPKGQYEAELQLSPTASPERWYIMASNCEDIISMDLKLTLLNPGGWWTKQFSVDEQGLLAIFVTFSILYTAAFLLVAYFQGSQFLKQTVSPIVGLVGAAVLLEYISLILQTVHGSRYAGDGVGLVALQAMGEISDAFSNCIIMAVLIYIAKGFFPAQDFQDLPNGWLFNTAIFITGFLSLFILDRIGRAMDQRYCYDSDIGVVIIVYRISAYIYFSIAISKAEAEASKHTESDGNPSRFMLRERAYFRICSAVWFLGVPAAYLASQFLATWDQMRVVIAVGVSIHTLGLIGLCWLVAPGLMVGGLGGSRGAWPLVASMTTPYDEI